MATDRTDTTRTGEPDRNPDPITGAPGSHPTGVGIGSASGAATGAAIGMLGGPVGAAIGIIAGGIVGGYVGKGVGEKIDPTEDDTYWRGEHKNRPYVTNDYDYDRDLAPAYRYGSTIGSNVGNDYDRPAGSGVGDKVANAAREAGHKVGEAYRDIKEKVAGSTTADAPTPTSSSSVTPAYTTQPYDSHENDIRAGWDKVRGQSGLSYDQARNAIRDAYDRRLKLREEQDRNGSTSSGL